MQTDRIHDRGKDPLGTMLSDFLHGDNTAAVEVESDEVEMWSMTGSLLCRSFEHMEPLEHKALELCHGRVLDVGAIGGPHALHLQDIHIDVEAIDISPGCVEVMRKRGVAKVNHCNLFQLEKIKFDTILMLMNGVGLCGSLDGLHLFFQFIESLLTTDGYILMDSTDLSVHGEYYSGEDQAPLSGEKEFILRYGAMVSDPFPWIYVDFITLRSVAEYYDFTCRIIHREEDGMFLAQINPRTAEGVERGDQAGDRPRMDMRRL